MADIFEIGEIEDQEAWDGLVDRSNEGTVFSTSSWLACAQAAGGGKVRRLGCFKNGHLVGGCGFLEITKGKFRKATTPLLTPYGGVLTVGPNSARPARIESERNKIITELVTHLNAEFLYLQFFHGTHLADIREFLWDGWTCHVLYTYLIDLRDLDQLWNAYFEKRTNNAIRKAEKSGFTVRKVYDRSLLIDLYKQIYAKQSRTPPVAPEIVSAFYQAAWEAGIAQMYMAEDRSGNPASVCVVVSGGDKVYAWVSGADPDADKLGATSLLYWRMFEDLATSHSWFDFVGANMPSIAKFKRGFGGVLHVYYMTEKHTSRLSAAAMKGYGLVRWLVRH